MTTTIDASGGSVKLGGVTLSIPPGALAKPTSITIEDTNEAPPATYKPYTHVYKFGPEGTTFAKPVTVTLPFSGNSALATLFWSKPTSLMTTGYDWLGGTVSGGMLSAQVSHFSKGFVADGVSYTDPPDLSCVRPRFIEGRTVQPAGVASFFAVDDCWGRPVTGLTQKQLTVKEDGSPISVEAGETIINKPGVQVFVDLMLDLSTSSAVQRPQLIAGAKAFVDQLYTSKLPVQVSLEVFTSSVATLLQPTLDTAPTGALQTQLDALSTYQPSDPNSTNLNGAIIQGLSHLHASEQAFEKRNQGGALTSGYVLVFTAGADTSKINTLADVLKAEAASPDGVLAVTLQGPDYDAGAMAALAPNGVIAAEDPLNLANAFGGLANRMAGEFQRVYLLGYCSPARSGMHTVSVSVAGATNKATADFQFDASGFGDGCSAALFDPASACKGKECGGLACGACDDRASVCDATSSRCQSYCQQAGKCSGETITNPLGYKQLCSSTPDDSPCGAVCVDTTSDAANCGSCGHACPEGGACKAGACSCPTGQTTCGSACVDTSTDAHNCGACGKDCGAGTCNAGVCTCNPGTTVCGGLCVDTQSDASNCGGCGVACDGTGCGGGQCTPVDLGGVPGETEGFTLSPDSKTVYVRAIAADNGPAVGTLYGVPTQGGAPKQIATGVDWDAYTLAADATSVYIPDFFGGNVWKIAISDGSITKLVSGLTNPRGLVRDGGYLYWVDGQGAKRFDLTTSAVETVAATTHVAGNSPSMVSVHGTNVYWAGDDGDYFAPITGGAAQKVLSASGENLATSSTRLFFLNGGLHSVPVAGGPVTDIDLQAGYGPVVADDVSVVYWVGDNVHPCSIHEASLSGGSNKTWGTGFINGIAMDSDHIYWAEGLYGTGVKKVRR